MLIDMVARLVRDFHRCQKHLWNQVPELALRAAVSCDYMSHTTPRSLAYTLGVWRLTDEIFVELETGELVRKPVSGRQDLVPVDDDRLARAVPFLGVTARDVIRDLENTLESCDRVWNAGDKEVRFAELRKEFRIENPYRRY